MAKAKKEIVQPKAPMAVVMRMASRVTRLPAPMRAAYIERAKTGAKSDHPTRNGAAVLVATGA
jgi:hypothetical protein